MVVDKIKLILLVVGPVVGSLFVGCWSSRFVCLASFLGPPLFVLLFFLDFFDEVPFFFCSYVGCYSKFNA